MITGLYNALVDRGLQEKIGILADESSSLSRATGEYADWLYEVIDMVRLHTLRSGAIAGSTIERLLTSCTILMTSRLTRAMRPTLPTSRTASRERRRG